MRDSVYLFIFVCRQFDMKLSALILSSAITFIFFSSAHAGGFQISSQSQKAASMGGSQTAMYSDAATVFYNPGGMVFIGKNTLSAGGFLLMPAVAYRSPLTGKVTQSDKVNIIPFYLGGSVVIGEKIAAGIMVNSPFGYATKWADNWEGRYTIRSARLKTVFIQPTASVKISEKFGFGAGFVMAVANYKWNRAVGVASASATDGDVSADGKSFGYGFNAGLHFHANDKLDMALTYRSKVKLNFKNTDFSFSQIPSSLSSYYPSALKADATMPLPSVLSLAFAYKATDELTFHLETNLTGWSSFDSLNYSFEENYNYLDNEFKQTRKYRDVIAVRLGVQYAFTETLQGRAGVAYDQSPVKDNFITTDMPDADKYVFGLGLGYSWKSGFTLECSYQFETKRERQGQNSDTQLDGSYSSIMHGAGLGISYKF